MCMVKCTVRSLTLSIETVSDGIGIAQPFAFLGVCRTFWMYGKVCLVAYTSDGYLRDVYR
jgi:hypothetical protein